MKNIYKLMMTYAMMGLMTPDGYGYGGNKLRWEELTDEERDEIDRVRKAKIIENKKRKGLKEFYIDGITVIALNRKNAIRKANNIKKLQSCI